MKPKVIVVKGGFIPASQPAQQQPRLPKPRSKGLLSRITEIVIDDIKSLWHKDRKSIEDKMRYEAFMELVEGKR